MFRKTAALLTLLTLLTVSCYATPVKKPVVGVLYLTSDNPEVSHIAVSSATTWLTRISSIRVVERMKLGQAFSEERLRREGIVQVSSAVGAANDADYVIIGEVSYSQYSTWVGGGGQAIVHLRLIDVRHDVGAVVWTGEGKVMQTGGDLSELIDVATSRAIFELRKVFPTRGLVLTTENNRVYIDLTTRDDIAVGDKVLMYPDEHSVLNRRTGTAVVVRGEAIRGKVVEAHEDYSVVDARSPVPAGTTVELVP